MVFPVVMYGCESWTVKKAERLRIDAFELWCWRRLLRVLDCKEIQPVNSKGNQFLNIHWKDWCCSWNSNPLATWCEELAHWKRPWCWERLKAGGEGVKEDEMVGWHHWLDGPEFEQAPGVGDGQGSLACCSPWGHRVRHDWASELNLCLLGSSKPIGWWGGKNLVFGVK